jgi:hypothetical protein
VKIRYFNTLDVTGGAAKGAHRLHGGLRAAGVNSRMTVCRKDGDDPSVDVVQSPPGFPGWRQRLEMVRPMTRAYGTTNSVVHSVNCFPTGLDVVLDSLGADVLIMHWIGAEAISIEELGRLRTPVVWRLADQWAFCGAEHYMEPGGPERFVEGYCPGNRPPGHRGFDLDGWTFTRKVQAWRDFHPLVVTGSRWLRDQARRSLLFRNERVEAVPSGLDLAAFAPRNKEDARLRHGLPRDKTLILFTAMNVVSDLRKGFDLLQQALAELESTVQAREVELVVLGDDEPDGSPPFGLPCHYLGRIEGDEAMSWAYSAADIAVAPSRLDNLPFTVMEAMACGVPCCAFDVGGMSDMIEHDTNGRLAPPYDTSALARGLALLARDRQLRARFSRAAREKVEAEFSIELQARRYVRLCEELLAR